MQVHAPPAGETSEDADSIDFTGCLFAMLDPGSRDRSLAIGGKRDARSDSGVRGSAIDFGEWIAYEVIG
jgi:hypothetical protein